jgi:redox-sensitive bicupin YhaK (pirin superfamily)
MPIERLVPPRSRDLGGGFMVRRLLPAGVPRQGVGPFVFFDHFGPVTTRPGDNHDVRPHPHIGLATVTYLFEGAMMHRDNLGSVQRIEPGAINWMTAGRGIVHSERTPPDLKQKEYVVHGLQLWAALPKAYEETAPEFTHTPATAIPEWSAPGIRVRVLVGNAFGLRSPVTTFCATLYLDVDAQAGGTLVLPPPEDAGFEQAIYSVGEPLQVDGDAVPAFSMAMLAPGTGATIEAPRGARYVVIGGEPLDAPRTIWWNFVASSTERIERAKADWSAQRMGKIAGEHDWIPLP